jgi:hypothetical protein
MIDAIKLGKDVLVEMQRETSVEDVEYLMLDTKEAIDQQRFNPFPLSCALKRKC